MPREDVNGLLALGRWRFRNDRHCRDRDPCLIFTRNEYAFAGLLTSGKAQIAPPLVPQTIGEGGQDWPPSAAVARPRRCG